MDRDGGVAHRVEVEGGGGSLAESALHGRLVGGIGSGVVEPVGVDGAVDADEGEREASIGEVTIESGDLVGDVGVGDVACSGIGTEWK